MRLSTLSYARRLYTAGARSCHDRLLMTACALAGLFAGALPAHASGDHVPDWVKSAAAQPSPNLPKETKAIVLLDEETYTVNPDGRAVEHVRRVVKVLRPQGREFAEPIVWSDADSKLQYMHVWSIDPAGHEYQMKDSEMVNFSPPTGGYLYSEDKARVAQPAGRDPGGVVAVEYELRERPYIAEADFSFQSELPRLKQSFTLSLPSTFSYTTTWAHHTPVQATDLENHSYRWDMDNEPAIDLENTPMAPDGAALAGRLIVHYGGPGLPSQKGTWQSVGQWYDGLMHDRLQTTPELAGKAAELTAGKPDFYDKASAIANFVQRDIRYFGVEIGIGGNQPHFAGDVYKNRFGDCKDKSTLLSAMLDSVGLHGTLVLVDSRRGFIDQDGPSSAGNHAIAAIEIPKGYQSPKLHSVITAETGKRFLIFDPTWEQTPFGQLEDNLQGGYGLLVDGDHSQIVRLPVMPPELNRLSRSGTFRIAADGTLTGKVVEKRYGDLAERRRSDFAANNAKLQQQMIDRSVAEDLVSASVTGLSVSHLKELDQELTTSFDLTAQHFVTSVGPLLMARPRVFGSDGLHVDRKARSVPIDLEQTMRETDDFEIDLPEGYVVDELPDPVKVDMGFATYQSSTEFRDGKLHYQRVYSQSEVVLPAKKYADVQKLAAIIASDEEGRAVLKRTSAATQHASTK